MPNSTLNQHLARLEPKVQADSAQDAIGPSLHNLIAEKDEQFTQLMMRGQSKFGQNSKQRRKKQRHPDQQPENTAQLNQGMGRGRGHGGGDMPKHPLLDGQRYDGVANNESPLAATSQADKLFEEIANAIENNPELANELTPSLQHRIELYNRQKLAKAMESRPTLNIDRRP
ncbi:MAG: hypothetical protein QM752_04860 [Gammaproteobacteria bacterium]